MSTKFSTLYHVSTAVINLVLELPVLVLNLVRTVVLIDLRICSDLQVCVTQLYRVSTKFKCTAVVLYRSVWDCRRRARPCHACGVRLRLAALAAALCALLDGHPPTGAPM
eukprot:SAG11_NODE_4112_length_2060_cov_6.684345_2_plen_110_part_00